MGLMDTIRRSVAKEVSESVYRPTHYAIVRATYKKRMSDIPGMPGYESLSDKDARTIEFKVPHKPKDAKDNIDDLKAKTYINSHPDHTSLIKKGWNLSDHEHKKNVTIKQHNEEVQNLIAEIESIRVTAEQEISNKKNLEVVKMESSSRPVGVVLNFTKKSDNTENLEEGKYNWDKEHKRGLTDTQGNRMLKKKAMPSGGPSKAALAVLAAKAKAAGVGGKIKEDTDVEEGHVPAEYAHKVSVSGVHAQMQKEREAFQRAKKEREAKAKKTTKEEVEIDEDLTKKSTKALQNLWDKHKDEERPSPVFANHLKMVNKELQRRKKMQKEEVENIDEISANTLDRYREKASTSDTSNMNANKAFARKTKYPALASAKAAAGKDDEDSKYALNRYKMSGGNVKVAAKEELDTFSKFYSFAELIEAKRGRPRKDGSSSGDEEGGREHIIVQLRKAENLRGERHTEFNDNSKHKLPLAHVKKALNMHVGMKPVQKGEFEARLAKSHQSFNDAVAGKPAEPAKPKVTLAKSAAVREEIEEGADPSTHRSDVGAITTRTMRKPDGSFVLVKTKKGRTHTADIIDAQESVDRFAKQYTDTKEAGEEKREGQGAPKGVSVDLTADSKKKYAKDPLMSKVALKLPPTVGNKAPGGEDTVYGAGKYAVAEERLLNNLYEQLDESNKEIFDNLIETEEGVAKLIEFATRQEV